MRAAPGKQRGNALVESALSLPLLIGAALLIGDLYNISLARAHLEQSATTIANTLSMQNRLDRDGLQALIDQAASPDILGDYELLISKVGIDRSMSWKPLRRGSAEGLCPEYAEGDRYTGELPEERTAADDDQTLLDTSLLVVQLCRNSDDLALSNGLLQDKDMQAIAFGRMLYNTVELDQALSEEAGVDDEE
ncbi:TadE/TadG family type IV pilus assembly protein [Phytopseudomonas dryadis]|uniref:Pilus assembly protein n=1 Tax=Phytopseudomonas dryadis TaxID=2487520 RepID=A0A4Q9QYC9_9GAMM|nr:MULTISPECIES: pilus assembly protein [Pseudomonas]TBU90032.1 hypothetical protein DNK44_16195 [Pseudomonas dryadis]TBV02668.1 hypothetical protein DNK34_18630 [Pseudomonas dryadis]TBV15520.1 hypothetical protein DNK41_17920 [Pseudomonas sp. FRB 230]